LSRRTVTADGSALVTASSLAARHNLCGAWFPTLFFLPFSCVQAAIAHTPACAPADRFPGLAPPGEAVSGMQDLALFSICLFSLFPPLYFHLLSCLPHHWRLHACLPGGGDWVAAPACCSSSPLHIVLVYSGRVWFPAVPCSTHLDVDGAEKPGAAPRSAALLRSRRLYTMFARAVRADGRASGNAT